MLNQTFSPGFAGDPIYEFRNAKMVIDRLHIQKLACDAIQEMRIKHSWEALDAEHDRKLWLKETGEDLPAEDFVQTQMIKPLGLFIVGFAVLCLDSG